MSDVPLFFVLLGIGISLWTMAWWLGQIAYELRKMNKKEQR